MIPPSLMIDGLEALRIVRERFTCGDDEAVAFLEDQIAAGDLDLIWSEEKPDPVYQITLNWLASAATWSRSLPDRADDGERAVTYRRHSHVWAFRIRRQQLEECCERAKASPTPPPRSRDYPRATPVLDRVVQAMREYIDAHAGADLRGMPGKVLEERFEASRDTCTRALRVIYGGEEG